MTEMLDVGNVDAFAERLHGSVTRPGDPDYDEVRALYNAMIDKRPALIPRCADRDDVGAEVIFADGSVVTADESNNDDLYWAIRGGGGNFGVITELKMRLHPISTAVAGPMFWELDKTADILKWYRDFILNAPEDLNGF